MRCKNCGWDNPSGNVKCEKCNAPLSNYIIGEEVAQTQFVASQEFNLKATAIGCSGCGYPIRPTDTECPMCGEIFSGVGKEQKKELITESVGSKSSMKGTVIQSVSSDKDFGDKERRKLTGFLISYSRSPNGTFFPLYEGKNSIGRGESSQICIQGDPNVSEKHLSVLYRTVDRKFKFKDEQSSNGTFINEELIDEGELKNLDKIRIGETRMLFMEIPLTAFE